LKKVTLLPYFSLTVEAGIDEAGRGPLAGPVYAAAVILPHDFDLPELNDSKKLTEKKRYELRKKIEDTATDFAIASVSNEEIDKINILNATFKAMHMAIEKLKITPEHLLIDGNRFKPYKNIPFTCIVKGDGKYANIAAASILAKTYRDDYMVDLAKKYPEYGWDTNKGYGTKKHLEAIEKYGITPHHRKSFLTNFLYRLDF